jgi:hypothetical protein
MRDAPDLIHMARGLVYDLQNTTYA